MDKVLIQRIFYLCILCTDRTIWTQWHRILFLIPTSVYIMRSRPNSTSVIAQGVVVSSMLLPVGQSRDQLGPDIKGLQNHDMVITWLTFPQQLDPLGRRRWGEGYIGFPQMGLTLASFRKSTFFGCGLWVVGSSAPQQPIVRWHMKIMYIKWCRCAFFFQCGTFFPFFFPFSQIWSFECLFFPILFACWRVWAHFHPLNELLKNHLF
jgi:hypothetical protein